MVMLVELADVTRVWAVGAVFGEAERLRLLHQALAERLQAGDKLIYLGNYLGHGPAIVATVDEVLQFQHRVTAEGPLAAGDVVHLRGAQEEMWAKLLQIQWAMQPDETFRWMMANGADATLRAYGGEAASATSKFRAGVLVTARWTTELREKFQAHQGHDPFLHRLASAAAAGPQGLLFVSAGLDPKRPLAKQNDRFWWGSSAFAEIDSPYEGYRLVVRGYDRERKGVVFGDFAASIDGGCGFGGTLAAVCFAADGEVLDRIEV